jgi:L-threonylcarbamoyladenylate synthase
MHAAAIDADAIARAADCLRRGGLVAFPTETVYGLGAHALDEAAVARLFAAKGRPPTDPLIVHVATIEDIEPLVSWTSVNTRRATEDLAGRFWPGPLTLVLPKSRRVPASVTANLDTVGVRIPAHAVARALLDAARIPVAAPSANLFSRPSPTKASHVLEDLSGRIDMVLDGGPTTVGVESTVLDLSSDPPRILRPGAITLESLRQVLPDVAGPGQEPQAPGAMPSPGMLSKHYAPRAPLTLYEGRREAALDRLVNDARAAALQGKIVGVLVAREDVDEFGDFPVRLSEIGSEHDLSGVATRLYAALRELDAAGVDVILARGLSSEGLGLAIRDRLRRAAAGRIMTC